MKDLFFLNSTISTNKFSLFTLILSRVIFGHKIQLLGLIGALLIISGVFLISKHLIKHINTLF